MMNNLLEQIKLGVVDYLAENDLIGAVRYVRSKAPILGLSGAMKVVKDVQSELGILPEEQTDKG